MAALVLALTACGSGAGGDDDAAPTDAACRQIETGECARPAGTDLAVTPVSLVDEACFAKPNRDLTIATSQAEWDALFFCETPVPAGFSFDGRRLAVIQVRCVPTEVRFAVETGSELVLGVFERPGGACIDPPVIVPLPASAKPVRLAHCRETDEGDCPPRA